MVIFSSSLFIEHISENFAKQKDNNGDDDSDNDVDPELLAERIDEDGNAPEKRYKDGT